MTTASITKPTPSTLARLIICPAYVGAPFAPESRLKFQGLHAIAVLRVIARHLKQGFQLKSLERRGRGFRLDLEFLASDGRVRVSEVKSARNLNEVHRIQAALYWDEGTHDEVVLSNGTTDIVLAREYVEEVHRRAEITRRFLMQNPDRAAVSFRPSPCMCRICANYHCPFLPNKAATDQGTFSSRK